MSSTLIQLFAKAPIKGQVKTRMQPLLDERQSLQLHRALTEFVCDNLCGSELAAVELWAGSNPEDPFFQRLCEFYSISVQQQRGGDLGARLAYAAASGLQRFEQVVLVGADCPFVDSGYLRQAVESLQDGVQVVIGPATDGGYVLLGVKSLDKRLFSSIDWGGDRVLRQTLERIKQLGWSHRLLAEQADIDNPADLKHLDQSRFPDSLRNFARFVD